MSFWNEFWGMEFARLELEGRMARRADILTNNKGVKPMYSYDAVKPLLFRDEAVQRAIIQTRDNVLRMINETGAVRGYAAFQGVDIIDSYIKAAIMDRIVELGDIIPVGDKHTEPEDRIYISAGNPLPPKLKDQYGYHYSIESLIRTLNEDNELYHAWQSNIAMAFVDVCCDEKIDVEFPKLHDTANRAAAGFLNLLTKNYPLNIPRKDKPE